MGKLMDDIVNTANNFANGFGEALGYTFDYSVESLAEVDDMLDDVRSSEKDENVLYNVYTMSGCYVFETARRNYGGEYYWLEDEQQPILVAGEPDFSVIIKAWEKTKGYLKNGHEDSLSFYIQGYKEHIERGKVQKGYRALIV